MTLRGSARWAHFPGLSAAAAADLEARASLGNLTTRHGSIDTPAFVFRITKTTLRPVPLAQARAARTQVVLRITYHLMLQPGAHLIAVARGLHRFTGWPGPIITDLGSHQPSG